MAGLRSAIPSKSRSFKEQTREATGKLNLLVKAPRWLTYRSDSDRKCTTTLHREGSEAVAFIKGAPEQVVALSAMAVNRRCSTVLILRTVLDRADRMAADGLRVLAVAHRTWPDLPAELTS